MTDKQLQRRFDYRSWLRHAIEYQHERFISPLTAFHMQAQPPTKRLHAYRLCYSWTCTEVLYDYRLLYQLQPHIYPKRNLSYSLLKAALKANGGYTGNDVLFNTLVHDAMIPPYC